MRLVRLLSLIVVSFTAALAARAQSVRWEPAESGMANAVVLVYENCEPDGQPELPSIPGVTFTPIGRTESMNMVNFQTTRSVMLSYLVRGRQGAPVQIPTFTVKTSAGPQRVAAFNAAAPAAPLESVASSRLIPERTSVWAGEIFGLNYELSASRRTNPQISPTFDWNAAPLVAEDWSKPEVTEGVTAGDRRVLVLFRTRAVAKTPTTLKLEAASHLLSIQTGTIAFGGLLTQPRMEQVSVTSDQPVIEVRPLPPAPPGFSGAVGQFKLVSKVVPEKAAVGEPVTWTLELSGTGNWPEIAGLPARDVSNDFQVVQPKAKRTPAEGKLFDVTLAEDVVLVPAKSGSYALGPISFTYFDPKSGSYKTISAPRTTVTITTPAVPQINLTPHSPQANEAAPPPADKKSPPPAAPAAPAGIPRDPLPGTAEASAPLPGRTLTGLCLAPFAAVLVFWGWLAVRRARATDPLRPRREARERLAQLLAGMQSESSSRLPPPASRLLQWQRDAAVLWQIAQAAPRAEAFLHVGGVPSPRSGETRGVGTPPTADAAGWASLWRDADRAIYGAKTDLPSDWVARAQAALAAKRLPGFNPLRLFLPRNLLPFAALVALLLVPVALLRAAELDAAAAYRKADFAAAEKGWRTALAQIPTNWIARHNLALALVQQDRPAEAAAHAAAAFVQHPSDPSVRWHFALAAEKSGAVPGPLAPFLHPGFSQDFARFASPAQWQRGLVASAGAAALALGVLLFNAYGRKSRRTLALAAGALVLSVCAGVTAFGGWQAYGTAAHPDATIVARATTLRSIPTEADTAQKATPLAAGSIALADKSFLGWQRLRFENGQTGWVRKDDLVPVWR
jgi:hypothetical protein